MFYLLSLPLVFTLLKTSLFAAPLVWPDEFLCVPPELQVKSILLHGNGRSEAGFRMVSVFASESQRFLASFSTIEKVAPDSNTLVLEAHQGIGSLYIRFSEFRRDHVWRAETYLLLPENGEALIWEQDLECRAKPS